MGYNLELRCDDMSDKSFNVKKSTLGIGVALILVFIVGFYLGGIFGIGGSISEAETTQKIQSLLNQNSPDAIFQLTERVVENGIYKVTGDIVDSQGSEQIVVYTTVDGAFLFPQIIPLEQESQPVQSQPQPTPTVPKSDVPVVELYIFSYCPAGSAALDTFSEVADLLKDDADFDVKFFSDMHGEYELQQNMVQECIQKVAPDKEWVYFKQFLETVYTECSQMRSVDCDKDASIELMESIGIDSDSVFECVENDGDEYYNKDKADASALQLRYSPSIVINGVYLGNIDRSPDGIKAAVCSSFNIPPEKCSEILSQQSNSAGAC
jgi:protein-disulfide isomerase